MIEEQQSTPEADTGATGADPVQDLPTFEDLGLSPAVIAAVREMGFKGPTEVQAKAIPNALAGKDLQVQSRTGSGKTAAFAIPFAERLIDPARRVPQAMVLCPTRELAIQVADECTRVTAHSNLEVLPIYGGAAMGPQITALRQGVHLIAGTPGRVLDHIRRGNLNTGDIRCLVLDECDEMLSMGFFEEISSILDQLPEDRQTMLFSATIPEDIQRMADRYLRDPVRLYLSEDFVGVREIQHIYYLVSGNDRPGDLQRVMDYETPELALIFCNTRDDTALVAETLRRAGHRAEAISSDLSQAEREQVMGQMRRKELRFLVATDIAARGIDLSDLTHVINYTFPDSADIYIHRTGRTGRAGKSGIAVSLVAPREIGSFYYLKLIHKIFPEERHLPSAEELATRREGDRFRRLMEALAGKRASDEMLSLARRVWSTIDGERLMALSLAHLLAEPNEVFPEIKARIAAPLPATASGPDDDPLSPSSRPRPGDRRDGRGRDDRGRGRDDRGRGRGREDRGRGRDDRGHGRDDRGRGREDGGRSRDDRGREERPAPPKMSDREDQIQRERKTTRTRRRDLPEDGSFTTPDGDVEHWEVLDSGAPPRVEVSDGSVQRLFINIGRRQGVQPDDLGEFIQREADLPSAQMISLQVRETHSYLSVAIAASDAVIDRLTGKQFKERTLRVERAKK